VSHAANAQIELGSLAGPAPRLHLLEAGPAEAPVALLIHGLGSVGQEMMAALRASLCRQGFRVVAVDRPGYGLSDPALKLAQGPIAQAAWLSDRLNGLGIEPRVIVAHSFGAAVGLCYARARQKPPAMVLINPFCRPTPPAFAPMLRAAVAPLVGGWVRAVLVRRAASRLVRRALRRACAPGKPTRQLEALCPQLLTQSAAVLAMAGELRSFNGDLRWLARRDVGALARTFILTALDDKVIPATRHGAWLAARLPCSEHHTTTGGHMLHHARPELVEAAVAAALEVDGDAALGLSGAVAPAHPCRGPGHDVGAELRTA
jgi:pimeloyl-ACP methyl ester carboxylesterase